MVRLQYLETPPLRHLETPLPSRNFYQLRLMIGDLYTYIINLIFMTDYLSKNLFGFRIYFKKASHILNN